MILVFVAYSNADKQVEIPLHVEESCTIAIAIRRSGILELFPEIKISKAVVGIYGKKQSLDATLQNNDRIEIYRPLQIDPKRARVLRAQKQKLTSTKR